MASAVASGSTSDLLDPFSAPQTWDVVQIGGVTSPGLCLIEGFERDNGWQVKKGKGSVGGTLTYTQKPPSEGMLTFLLWSQAHFRAWGTFRANFLYNPAAGVTDNAVSIYHPSLADIQLSSVVCKGISPARHLGRGKFHIKVKLIEYAPTPKVSAVQSITFTNPSAPGPLGSAAGTPTPTAAQKLKTAISGLVQQLQSSP